MELCVAAHDTYYNLSLILRSEVFVDSVPRGSLTYMSIDYTHAPRGIPPDY